MKKIPFLAVLFVLGFFPCLVNATHEEVEGRAEISQGWVNRHDEKLDQVVKDAVKGLKVKGTLHRRASLKRPVVPMKGLRLSIASKHSIPMSKKLPSGAPVPLVALYQAQVQGQSFLIADYADEVTDIHCSSDIYWKLGLIYRPLFHGTGYRGCARVMTLGKESPIFFEVATYRGGTRCDKTIYTFNRPGVSLVSEHLYDHPEDVRPENYILTALTVSIWLDGFTLYRDVDKDGLLDVVNVSQDLIPKDLKEMLKKKYRLVDNDFDGAFRKVASFYKWNDSKDKFDDIGDHYY